MAIKYAVIFMAMAMALAGCATNQAKPPERAEGAVTLPATQMASTEMVRTAELKAEAGGAIEPARPGLGAGEKDKGGGPWVVITPLSSLSTRFSQFPDANFSDTYTRLIVTDSCDYIGKQTKLICGLQGNRADGEKIVLDYNPRNWFQRFFWGVRHTINLTSKVTVGTFTATVPLVTIDHLSNRTEGEGFTRIVYHSAQNYPLFLVKGDGSNGIVSVQFAVRASDQTQSSVAGMALQVAQSVTKFVSPQSAVLTTLTQQSTKDIAAALDKTVSQLLATSVDEEQWVDSDIRQWHYGARVTFKIPEEEGEWDNNGLFKNVGNWVVSFADPRPSIFSDVQICATSNTNPRCKPSFNEAAKQAQDETSVKSAEVLSFQLVNAAQSLGTVASYLKQQDWWANAQRAFSSGAAVPSNDDVSQFCRSIKNTIAGLNLNSVDAGIVAVAIRNGALLSSAVVTAMKGNADCQFAVP